jgi:hypothetical protein
MLPELERSRINVLSMRCKATAPHCIDEYLPTKSTLDAVGGRHDRDGMKWRNHLDIADAVAGRPSTIFGSAEAGLVSLTSTANG